MRQKLFSVFLNLVSVVLVAQELPVSGWSSAFRDWSDASNHFISSPGTVESASGILGRTKTRLEQGTFRKLDRQSLENRLIVFLQSPAGGRVLVGGLAIKMRQGFNVGAYAGNGRIGLLAEASLDGYCLMAGIDHFTGATDRTVNSRFMTGLKRRVQLRGPIWSYATVVARWLPDPGRILKLESGVSLAAGLEWHFGSGSLSAGTKYQWLQKQLVRRKTAFR